MQVSTRNEPDDSPDSNKWLKKLQQESWELELLVSGFSVLLLIKGVEFLKEFQLEFLSSLNFQLPVSNWIVIFMYILILSIYAMIFNLGVHLIFRGFWVGIVGLGSVAPGTNFEKLKYSKYFTEKLKKRITSLDDLVVLVDKISSVVFAFAFLIIFLLISFALVFGFIVFLNTIGNSTVELFSGIFAIIISYIFNAIILTLSFFAFLYLFDFLTFGFLKKWKYLGKIYYPFYRFFGWITFAFIYRTIYYNLISKFTKKKTALILIPYLIILISLPGLKLDHHIYFPFNENDYLMNSANYHDQFVDERITEPQINSSLVNGPFMSIFIPYNPNDNAVIRKLCPDYEPAKKEGLNLGIAIERNEDNLEIHRTTSVIEPFPEKSLECLKSLYIIKINDQQVNVDRFLFKTENKSKGIFSYINIDSLSSGYNELMLYKYGLEEEKLILEEYSRIPFWKQD